LEKNGEVRRTRLAPREAIVRGVKSSNEAEDSTDDETLRQENARNNVEGAI